MSEDRYRNGMQIRREVLGDEHVDRAEADKTEFDSDFQRFLTEVAWGTVWSRPGLGRRTRHLITIAILASMGRESELAAHIRATPNTGVTPQDLKEVLHHLALYAGLPAANSAFGVAKRVFSENAAEEDAQEGV